MSFFKKINVNKLYQIHVSRWGRQITQTFIVTFYNDSIYSIFSFLDISEIKELLYVNLNDLLI